MDRITREFLASQAEEGMALAAASDILDLLPVGGDPPQRYIAAFRVKCLVRSPDGEVVDFDRFDVGIWLPDDYQRRAEPPQVLTYLGPSQAIWHPNVRPPFICLHIRPGMPLVELLYALHDLARWELFYTGDEGLNHAAAQWARSQDPARFPLDRRPLKRRALDLSVRENAAEAHR